MNQFVPSSFLTYFVWIPFLAWAAALYLGNRALTPDQFKSFSTYLPIVPVLALAFDKYLWRVRIKGHGIVSTPVLVGTWKGKLTSSYRSPGSMEPAGSIDAYLVVHQTFSSIQVMLMTEQSCSTLLSGSIRTEAGEPSQVMGIYRNTPGLRFRDSSRIHFGAVVLSVSGTASTILRGEYWTDRDTKGELVFDTHDKRGYKSFKDAASGIYA